MLIGSPFLSYLTIKSGSIWPGIAFHFVNNSIGVLVSRVTPLADALQVVILAGREYSAREEYPKHKCQAKINSPIHDYFSVLP